MLKCGRCFIGETAGRSSTSTLKLHRLNAERRLRYYFRELSYTRTINLGALSPLARRWEVPSYLFKPTPFRGST